MCCVWLLRIQSSFLAKYHLHPQDTVGRVCHQGPCPTLVSRWAHAPKSGPSGVSSLEMESWPKGQRDWTWWLAISAKHLCNDQKCLISFSPDLFLRIPLSPEIPDSLLGNSLLLKFINLPPDNSEKATDNKLLGRKWHNEKDCDWHLEKGRPGFESQFYHSPTGYP